MNDMIDFKLTRTLNNIKRGESNYEIEMNSNLNNEIPYFTDDYSELHTQTMALFSTINRGQIPLYDDFGIQKVSRQVVNMQGMYEVGIIAVLEDIAEMVMEYFEQNDEIREWGMENYLTFQMTGGA